MMRLRATIRPTAGRTQILVTKDGDDCLRASLPLRPAHPLALRTLLEGLALWHDHRVEAVLVVDGPSATSPVDTLLDGELWSRELAHVRFDIRVRRKPKRLRGPGDFRRLYLLHGNRS